MAYEFKPLYLQIPAFTTPELNSAEESFLKPWSKKHELLETDVLYHYTDLKGLQGIVKERSIWLGHASSFNDPNEIQFGQNVILGVLSDMIAREGSLHTRQFLQQLRICVDSFWSKETGPNYQHVFVACFSESENSLSQWRAYANQGGGYCVGFGFSESTKIALDCERLDAGEPPHLRKVIYDRDEQGHLVTEYLESVVKGVRILLDRDTSNPQYRPSDVAVMAIQAVNVLLDMLICFKHPAFEEEHEWRLILVALESYEPRALRFREADGGLVPYRPAYIFDEKASQRPLFPLRSVTLGPLPEPIRTRSALELLLHHIAADDHPIEIKPRVDIRPSGYRLR
jgi:hypothetical protein